LSFDDQPLIRHRNNRDHHMYNIIFSMLEPSGKADCAVLPTSSSSRNSPWGTPGENNEGSRMAHTTQAALEPPGFSPGVSKIMFREVEYG
jgi:hypothetical protein